MKRTPNTHITGDRSSKLSSMQLIE